MPRSCGRPQRIIMRNTRNVRGEIGRINSPNAQLTGSMNFSETDIYRSGAAYTHIAQVEPGRDNIIKVTTLMGALLKRVYYSSAIIRENARIIYRTNILKFFAIRAKYSADDLCECQRQSAEITSAISFEFSNEITRVQAFISWISIQKCLFFSDNLNINCIIRDFNKTICL